MVGPAWKVPSPLPSSTEMVLSLRLATTKSGLPSPLKSPTATKAGASPTRELSGTWKVPSPLPSSTATLLEPMLATAKSSLPSPLKSPTATDAGSFPPVGKSRFVTNDIVWARAGSGRVVAKNKVAATQSASLAKFPAILNYPLGPGPVCIDSLDEPSRLLLKLAVKSAAENYVNT